MMTERGYNRYRRNAWRFFQDLEQHLSKGMPPLRKLRKEVGHISKDARESKDERERRNTSAESAFWDAHVLRPLHDFVATWPGMDEGKARQALLVEGYEHYPDITLGSPQRGLEHPFGKRLGATTFSTMARWKSGRLFGGSFPDMALRKPFPYRTVFECKFFPDGDVGAGERALVAGVYEVFYYLGLPKVPKRSTYAAWDYDFGCLLAGDASDEGSLYSAWKRVRGTVGSGFWDSANIYVMILRGNS